MPLGSARVVHRDRACAVAAVLDAAKPGCATIKKRTNTKSAGGGDTVTWSIVATDIPFRARISNRTTTTSDTGAQQSEASRWELSFPNDTPIEEITHRVYGDGRVWDVLEVGPESYDPELRVVAVEVER